MTSEQVCVADTVIENFHYPKSCLNLNLENAHYFACIC